MSNPSNKAVIIIQSDHGQYELNSEWIRQTPWDESVPILNVFYFPDESYDDLYESITPVNTFRVVSDHFLGTNLGTLPDLSYDFGFPADFAHPHKFEESWPGCSNE